MVIGVVRVTPAVPRIVRVSPAIVRVTIVPVVRIAITRVLEIVARVWIVRVTPKC